VIFQSPKWTEPTDVTAASGWTHGAAARELFESWRWAGQVFMECTRCESQSKLLADPQRVNTG